MRKFSTSLLTVSACLGLQACAQLTHLTRDKTLDPAVGTAKAEFIDAKQRAVIAVKVPVVRSGPPMAANASGDEPGQLRFCAEPSPDALSALSASGSLGLSAQDKVSLTQSGSFAESAASIGLRTQSIQLMRDAMYRVCEGYASGALSEGSFETLNRRFQSSMVAILAIEQLTGAVRARQVVLGGSAGTGAADAILKATAQSREALTALKASQTELDAAKAKAKTLADAKDASAKVVADAGAAATTEQQTAAKDALTAANAQAQVVPGLEKTVSDNQTSYNIVEQGRVAIAASPTSATGSGAFATGEADKLDAASITAVSGAVKDIVDQTMGLQFSNELCSTVLTGVAYRRVGLLDDPVVGSCLNLMDQTKQRLAVDTRFMNALAKYLEDHPNLKSEEVVSIVKAKADMPSTGTPFRLKLEVAPLSVRGLSEK